MVKDYSSSKIITRGSPSKNSVFNERSAQNVGNAPPFIAKK